MREEGEEGTMRMQMTTSDVCDASLILPPQHNLVNYSQHPALLRINRILSEALSTNVNLMMMLMLLLLVLTQNGEGVASFRWI